MLFLCFSKILGVSVVSVSVTFTNGKGSLTHNNREFSASNVRREFTKNNVILKRQDLNEAYEEIFNESCEINNERQKRADRKLSPDQYLKKIEAGQGKENNPKSFYESIVQVGNMYDTGIINNPEKAETAKEVLKEYFQEFEENNPNIHVFNATIHMDEQTPHMHIDWVPVAGGYKTGMPKRNSLEKALEQQGVKADGKTDRRNNNRAVWQEREANRLIEVCKRHGIEASFNRHEKAEETLSINDFKKISKIAERKANALSKEIEKMSYFEFIRNGKEKVLEAIMEAKNAQINAQKAEMNSTLEFQKKEKELKLREKKIEQSEQPIIDLKNKLLSAEMGEKAYKDRYYLQNEEIAEKDSTIDTLKKIVQKTAERSAVFEAISEQQALVLDKYPINPVFKEVINREAEQIKNNSPKVVESKFISPKVYEAKKRINEQVRRETMKREYDNSLRKERRNRSGMER